MTRDNGLSFRSSSKLPTIYRPLNKATTSIPTVKDHPQDPKRLSRIEVWVICGCFPLICRIIAMEGASVLYSIYSVGPFVIGLIQDGFVAFELYLLFFCFHLACGGRRHVIRAFVFLSTLLLLINLPAVIDILMLLQHHPRLNWSFISMVLCNGDQFLSSAGEAMTKASVCLLTLWLLVSVGGAYRILLRQGRVPGLGKIASRNTKVFSQYFIWWAFALYVNFAIYLLQPKPTTYVFTNSALSLQLEAMRKLHGADSFVKLDSWILEKQTWIAPTEVYTGVGAKDEQFPLFRKTTGFTGDKLFNIKVEKELPNVLLIMMEAWRAKNVGVLGGQAKYQKYHQTATPRFDEFSNDGVLFENHYTPSIQTSRSIMSTLFGILPWFHVASAIPAFGTRLNLHGLPHFLKQKGYYNAFISATDLSWDGWDHFLYHNGFDELVDSKTTLQVLKAKKIEPDAGTSWGLHDGDGFNGLYEKIHEYHKRDRPFFIDFYSISSHHPFKLPPSYTIPDLGKAFATPEEKSYVDAMRYSDEQLGKLIDRLRRDGIMNNTIVLIQGDHGFGRYEHEKNPGSMESRVWDEGTHTPLLLLADGKIPKLERGKRISQVSSQADTMATIADIVGIDQQGLLQHGIGQSLVRSNPNRTVLLVNPFQGGTVGVRKHSHKIVSSTSGTPLVYDLKRDPGEQNPISESPASSDDQAEFVIAEAATKLHNVLYEQNRFRPPVEQ